MPRNKNINIDFWAKTPLCQTTVQHTHFTQTKHLQTSPWNLYLCKEQVADTLRLLPRLCREVFFIEQNGYGACSQFCQVWLDLNHFYVWLFTINRKMEIITNLSYLLPFGQTQARLKPKLSLNELCSRQWGSSLVWPVSVQSQIKSHVPN